MSKKRTICSPWLPAILISVVSALVGVPAAYAQWEPNLVSWWPADGDATDAAGVNDGTPMYGATFAPGRLRQAFSFDGIDDHVDVPDSASLDAITSEITVEAWINAQPPAYWSGLIFARRDPLISEGFSIVVTRAGELGLWARTTTSPTVSGSGFYSAPGAVTLGALQHIALTASTLTGEVRAYVNGHQVWLTNTYGPDVLSGSLFNVNHLFIGRRQSSATGEGAAGAAHYRGLIDELAVYDRALTEAEIQTLYNMDEIGAEGDLYVSSYSTNTIIQYDGTTGLPVGLFVSHPDLNGPSGLLFNSAGNLLVVSSDNNKVLEFDGDTGALIGTFASGEQMNWPVGLVYAPNGNLLVANYDGNNVVEFDGTTGAFIRIFADDGLAGPESVVIGPNGNLFVDSYENNRVIEFDIITGERIGTFEGPELDGPYGIVYRPNGNLIVSCWNTGQLLEYDGNTRAYIDVFATPGGYPGDLKFGPNGNLFNTNWLTHTVVELDANTGALIGTFASGGGLNNPYYMVFKNQPPEITCNDPVVLWSPQHELVDVSSAISVSDPNGDPVTLTIRVYSDETEIPDTGDGTGRHAPDFKDEHDGGRGLLVRSERRAHEDGRFYIGVITADDGNGGVTQQVCVLAVCPHDQTQESLDNVLNQANAAAAAVDFPTGLNEHGLSGELGPHQ